MREAQETLARRRGGDAMPFLLRRPPGGAARQPGAAGLGSSAPATAGAGDPRGPEDSAFGVVLAPSLELSLLRSCEASSRHRTAGRSAVGRWLYIFT